MNEPICILEQVVLAIHDMQLAEHGGLTGVRDSGLLQSALHHPQQLFAYSKPTIIELAAAYAERICKNHLFIDGNKRTAYVTMLVFLDLNGYTLVASKEERVIKFVQLASSTINLEEFTNWLEQNIQRT